MTVLLVLFTLILFLTCDHFVQRHRAHHAVGAHEQAERVPTFPFINFPHEVALATNHTWLRNNPDGTTTIGVDEFLGRLIGVVEKISLPRTGEKVVPAVAGIGMQSRGRALHITAPLAGQVVAANADVLKNPSLLVQDPYGRGWLMKVKSHVETASAVEDVLVSRPIEWLNQQVALLRDFLAMNSPQVQAVVLQEGGLPVEGVLQQFNADVWEKFGQSFATLQKAKDADLQEARS